MTDREKFFSSALTRRDFLATSSAALVGAYLVRDTWGQAPPLSPPVPLSGPYVKVETSYGKVRGAQGDGLVRFRGIPYAGSVSGANRFKTAPPLKSWTGVRDALEFGPPSMQPGRGRANEPAFAEDCLFLNVWTPAADGRKRPVMFYSHGGGFTTGSGAAAYQDGSKLARTWDVVVVATNHRLGLLGYLYLGELGGEEYATSGNQGLEDIRDGLKWVHGNIERFGGDPNNVMIFGESGGGAKTSCLYAMPSAAPYFNKASVESGPGLRLRPLDAAARTTEMVLQQLGLDKSQWRQLLEVPADKLVEIQGTVGRPAPSSRGPQGRGPSMRDNARYGFTYSGAGGGFAPTLDGHIMDHDPFYPTAAAISKNKPLIVGYNRDEMNFFFSQQRATDVYSLTDATLKERLARELGANADAVLDAYKKSRPGDSPADLYVAIATARFDVIGSVTIAERKYAQQGAPVYMYNFVHESKRLIPGTNHIYGAAHAAEIVYKFNNVPAPEIGSPTSGPTTGSVFGSADQSSIDTALNMSGFWSSFARTGHPSAKGQPAWPPYTAEKRATMFIDAQCKVVDDPYRLEREVWDKVDPG
ncbi:MAG: carboxylesterase/lipase family protein [Candidatus Acidiferrales bacterium]